MGKLKVKPQTENPNRHNSYGMGLLETSIGRDGWIDAITVAADDESISGSARIETGAAKGWDFAHEEPLVIQAPKDRPIVIETTGGQPIIHRRTDIPNADDPRARRLSVAANQITAVDWTPDAGILAAWAEGDDAIKGLFTEQAWINLLGQAGTEIIDANELWKGMPEFEQEDLGAWKSIHVHFANKEDYEAFGRLVNQVLTDKTRSIWHPYRKVVGIERGASVEDES